MTNPAPLRDFILDQARQRLDRLALEAARSVDSQDEDAIHDLRVAMRRFSQSLILFPDLFPPKAAGKINRRIKKKMMERTAEVRNRDIAMAHLVGSGDKGVLRRLGRERAGLVREFHRAMLRWQTKDFAALWRTDLRLERP